jgi:micrococcal nuclease
MRRRIRPLRASTALVLVVLLAWAAFRLWQIWPAATGPDALTEGQYQVARVVDGDTLLLTNRARVRLIGVDTPETVKPNTAVEPWGPEATVFTRSMVAAHEVRLQFDRERVDRYGRFLAYVWVGDQLLNEELLRAGLARWEPQYHYSQSMKTRFRKAQQEAQRAQRGIWSDVADSIPADR